MPKTSRLNFRIILFRVVIFISPLFLTSCAGVGIVNGELGADQNITQVKSIAIFPFPGNNSNTKWFYKHAPKELWGGRAKPGFQVLFPSTDYQSKDEILNSAWEVGAKAALIGCVDQNDVLHLKAINLNTKKVWLREGAVRSRREAESFIAQLKSNFVDGRDINFDAESAIRSVKPRIAILPANNETTDLKAGDAFREVLGARFGWEGYEVVPPAYVDEVLRSSFSVSDGGQLGIVPVQELVKSLNVDGLLYTTVHDFAYQNVGVYQSRKVSATLTAKNKSGEILWVKNIAAKSEEVHTDKILINAFAGLLEKLVDTLTDKQLVEELNAAAGRLFPCSGEKEWHCKMCTPPLF